jgi:hypothetical protein
MKDQVYNKGELKELKAMIDKNVAESAVRMAANQGIPLEDLIVIALQRYRSSHLDADRTRESQSK